MKFFVCLLLLWIIFYTDVTYAQDCSPTTWTTWACSVTCGNGTFTRSRNCTTNTTVPCYGCWELPANTSFEVQRMNCSRDPCPFCTWTNFTAYSCSSSCNTGYRLQTRQCLTSGGQPCGLCDGEDVISEPCVEQPVCDEPCPINSHTERNYTDCGVTCQSRNNTSNCTIKSVGCVCDPGYFRETIAGLCVRECDCGCVDASSGYHQLNSVWNGTCATYICNPGGVITQIGTICNTNVLPTPTNGDWSAWTDPAVVVCSATCGNGSRPQYRTCTNPAPANGGLYCNGSSVRLLRCTTNILCPGTDTWSGWSTWSSCSVSCGNGIRTAYRNCTSASVDGSGSAPCNGPSINTTSCYAGVCPIDGVWTSYNSYSICSAICGYGLQASYRDCVNETAGGLSCSGYGLQFRNCSGYNSSYQCDEIGYWSNWTSFGACSVSCGVGYQYQTRQCLGAGIGCIGDAINITTCNTSIICPVDGNWTTWSTWSSCPATCGTASVYRTRNCTGALNGGVCLGSALDTQSCDTNVTCVVNPFNATNGGYTVWSAWSACSTTCGTGVQVQTRACTNPLPSYGGSYCVGSPINITSCNSSQSCSIDGNWAAWSNFSQCSGTCGNGTRTRVRICGNPAPANGGQQCDGSTVETEICSTGIDCPVDGVWGSWSAVSACVGTCGNGTRVRTRTCTLPLGGGLMCIGATRLEETCDLNRPCPIDGEWSTWSNYSACSVTCGTGVYTRVRECNNPTPNYGGDQCIGSPIETAYCQSNVSCPVDGAWTQWTDWSSCSLNCSGGTQTRTRNCTNPSPANNGAPCTGSNYQYQKCNDQIPCIVLSANNPTNGTWSDWAVWGTCASTCGSGTRARYRNCTRQTNGGNPCIGVPLEYQACATNITCPIDGGWSNYTEYGPCSVTCANGIQIRTRTCNTPLPQYGGLQCVGDTKDIRTCATNISCPIDGGWSNWAESACSSTCGVGYRLRFRNCSNPSPQFGGITCIGSAVDTILCNISNVTCPVMGIWGEWSNATNCSVSCGYGIRIRNRTCLPAGSINCDGTSVLVEACDSGSACTTPKPWNSTNGNWSQWSDWSACSASCGNGTQYQTRACNTSSPILGGSLCSGDALRIQSCNTNVSCPVNGNWSEWGSYSSCSTTCGPGIRTRFRYCNNTNNFEELCIGHALETAVCNENKTCPVPGIWENWTTWSVCSGTCGIGLQVRTRNCTVVVGGEQCSGSSLQAQECETNITCPVDGGWGSWTSWTNCSSTSCASGSRYRFRTCDSPQPSNGGQLCAGNAMETTICDGSGACPVDGNWASWSTWTICSSTCAGGRRYRNRTCSNPVPSSDGIPCVGSSVEVDGGCGNTTCAASPTISIGVWTSWYTWSACATTCGLGIRRRVCNALVTVRNCSTTGLPCVGSNYEVESCNSLIGCPVDGTWSDWSTYSECTASCSSGTQTRTRLCTGQSNGGQPCFGSATQTITCSTNINCPSLYLLSRKHSNTAHFCNTIVDGQWTTWSEQSPCSVTCGTGVTVRTRTCAQVIPKFGGVSCPGSSTLTETCTASQNCPIDGAWSSWKDWSACSATCGKTATKYTTRVCDNPQPLYGGNGCDGVAFNVTSCPELIDCSICPISQMYINSTNTICPALCSNPTNTTWCLTQLPGCMCRPPYAWNSATNSCSLWCDCGCYGLNNTQHALGTVWMENSCRTYQCMKPNNTADTTPQAMLISNNCSNCSYFSWTAWSTCSALCGLGTQTRQRSCLYLNSFTPCDTCDGVNNQSQICQNSLCEVCQFGPFVPATTCTKTCGNGTQVVNRTCYNIASSDASIPIPCSNSSACGTFTNTTALCNTYICNVCTWSAWANTPCTVTCGQGTYVRQRTCVNNQGVSCTTCTPSSSTNGPRPCYYPSCISRRRRSIIDWFASWFDD
ncbi:unnamed protein product [Adineta ricciae]|uniref:G-protein coupled receptors family 2 profile 1 domain-containing protein n=1 Tax=Adineta ricciae TaxID=249248 RepID=A0A814AHH0_ADIRI|nr:unnamed protein product [Adineta ricciae]